MEKNKILIVEDNKALAKLIAKKMEDNTEMQVDVAHSLAEAQAFLTKAKDYFITLQPSVSIQLSDTILNYQYGNKEPQFLLSTAQAACI